VVGGTGAIGSGVVDKLLAEGVMVLATGRSEAGLADLASRGAHPLHMELADRDVGEQIAAAARSTLGDALDGLVVSAGGVGPIGVTRAVDPGSVEATLREHLLAPLAILQSCAPLLDAAPAPAVVLLSGGGATGPFPRYAAYALAKVALVRAVENLAAEEAGWRVNAVAPGFVASAIHAATLAAGAERVGAYYDETVRRLERPESAERAGELIAFLLSDAAAGITGRLVSAPWDPWDSEDGRTLLREHPSFGRLRRIDLQRYVDEGASEPSPPDAR